VPFEYLRRIGETYCGTPLDSDDEDRAWQASGSTSELREQQQQQHQRRQAQSSQKQRGAEEPQQWQQQQRQHLQEEQQHRAAADTSESSALALRVATSDGGLEDPGAVTVPITDLATAVAGNKGSAVPLGSLLEAATKDSTAQKAPLRAQMSHSIVEKRRRERRAPPDMALGELRVRRSALTASTNPATPVPNVSLALLQTPIPFNSPLASSLSPISVRGNMRRQHLLESPLRFPEWGLLDTPLRPKPK